MTGQDLCEELCDKPLEKTLLIPGNMLRAKEDVFLDGMTVSDVESALHVRIVPVSDGADLVRKLFEDFV